MFSEILWGRTRKIVLFLRISCGWRQFEADAIDSARAFFEGWGIPIVVDVLNAADAE